MPDQPQGTEVFSYGDHPDQHVSLMHPERRPSLGTAILVHGGYWRQRINASVMQPLVVDLLRSGWSVANVEYRRGREHSWPIPSSDTAKAIALVCNTLRRQGRPDTAILIGHSVGGQLVLLNSGLAKAVVGLAPVTDAGKVHAEGLGDDAAKEYFGGSPAEIPAIYRAASPIQAPSPKVPVLLVHGADDDRVPLDHSLRYLQTLPGDARTDQIFPPHLDHFEIIDPAQHHWSDVCSWMEQMLADARTE